MLIEESQICWSRTFVKVKQESNKSRNETLNKIINIDYTVKQIKKKKTIHNKDS